MADRSAATSFVARPSSCDEDGGEESLGFMARHPMINMLEITQTTRWRDVSLIGTTLLLLLDLRLLDVPGLSGVRPVHDLDPVRSMSGAAGVLHPRPDGEILHLCLPLGVAV